MEIRAEKVQDFYPTMKAWAKKHNFELPQIEVLPYDIFVLKENDIDTYCMGVFIADQAAMTVFPLSNKGTKRSRLGLELLHKTIEKYVKQFGVFILLTTTATPRIRKALENCGWNRGDICVDQYMKVIN
jgi:hypothetical protein